MTVHAKWRYASARKATLRKWLSCLCFAIWRSSCSCRTRQTSGQHTSQVIKTSILLRRSISKTSVSFSQIEIMSVLAVQKRSLTAFSKLVTAKPITIPISPMSMKNIKDSRAIWSKSKYFQLNAVIFYVHHVSVAWGTKWDPYHHKRSKFLFCKMIVTLKTFWEVLLYKNQNKRSLKRNLMIKLNSQKESAKKMTKKEMMLMLECKQKAMRSLIIELSRHYFKSNLSYNKPVINLNCKNKQWIKWNIKMWMIWPQI